VESEGKDLFMKNRHLIAALIALTPVAAFAQVGAPGAGTPPTMGVTPGDPTGSSLGTMQDPATGRADPGTVPPTAGESTTVTDPAAGPTKQDPAATTGTTTSDTMTTDETTKTTKKKKPRH
jgi:hypothetical protein